MVLRAVSVSENLSRQADDCGGHKRPMSVDLSKI
jgi:hypothetical protein